MKIEKQAKIDVYYLILFWATKEAIKQNVFFIDKNIMLKIAFINRIIFLKKQKQNKSLKNKHIKLLSKVQNISTDMKLLSFEMLVYIALNWLKNEIQDKDTKRYEGIQIHDIFDRINKNYRTQLNEHCDFIEKIEEEL